MVLQIFTGDRSENLLVTIVITLFILSLISERLANFLKLNLQSLIERFSWFRGMFEDKKGNKRFNFRTPEIDPECEKLRERGIMNIAILCGIFTAVLTGADLFYLIASGGVIEYRKLNVSSFELNRILRWSVLGHIIGFVATGFFISLGSKFWHDLLDIVLYTSNLKRKIADPRTYQGQTIAEIEEFLNLTPIQLAELAEKQHGNEFRERPGVLDVTYGVREVSGRITDVLLVYVREGSNIDIQPSVSVRLESGRTVSVPTLVIATDGQPKVQFSIGDSIHRSDSHFSGSFACLLEGNDGRGKPGVFGLTCNHVFTDRNAENLGGWLPDPTQEVMVDGNVVGKWWYGLLNHRVDIALVKLDAPDDYNPGNFNNLSKTPRLVTKKDVNKLPVKMQGALSQTTGFLVGLVEGDRELKYGNSNFKIKGLLEVAHNTTPHVPVAISKEGDSGALVYDFQDNPVGLLVAGDSMHSYVIPFTAVLEQLKTLSIRV